MLSLITQGVTLGVTAGVLPGPLQTFIIQTTLVQGWRKSIVMIFSPLIADLPVIVLTTVVLSQIPPEFIRLIQIVGGLFVLWLARGAWLSFRAGGQIGEGDVPPLSRRQLLARTVLVNILSPGPYIFWATVNGPLLVQGLRESVLHAGMFLLAFYGSFLVVLSVYVVVFSRIGTLDARITRALLLVITALLVLFGLSLIGQGIGLL